MANITEPEVVFCEFNHIYDRSLNDTCPYCKQIAERTSQMKRQINGPGQKMGGKFWNFLRSGRSSDVDATVLLRNAHDDDDDATVLVSGGQDDDDATELHTVARVTASEDEKTEYRPAAGAQERTELRRAVQEPAKPVAETVVRIKPADSVREGALPVLIREEPVRQPVVIPEKPVRQTVVIPEKPVRQTVVIPEEPVRQPVVIPVEPVRPTVVVAEAPVPQVAVKVVEAKETAAAPAAPRRKVIGWLVCTAGEPNYGTSVELREGSNGVQFDDNGRVRIGDEGAVVIYRDRVTGIFRIRAEGDTAVTVNERTLNGSSYLEPYSGIQIGEHSFVFFPAVGVCGFEWRQS